jgi:hypothetical protein
MTPNQIPTTLFGPKLYAGGSDLADGLKADIDRIPELRRHWYPDLADRLFDPDCPVGCYDTPVRGLVSSENSVDAQTQHCELSDTIQLATDAPKRLGISSTREPVFTVFNRSFSVPATDFWRGAAEQLYGFAWCIADQTRSCPQCVHGSAVSCVFGAPFDYFHFIGELSDVVEDSCRAMAAYIDHVHRNHGPQSRESVVMDSWLACLQGLYLDVLHPKASRIAAGNDERRGIRYRIVNSAGRALALLTALERPTGAITNQLVEATGFAGMVMHDACDRRHDNAANESHNFLTLLAIHNQTESLASVRRFCVDLWAWAVDHDLLWPILMAGRTLIWNVYVTRYQTPVLLDHLTPPTDTTSYDPYADPILNRMNPAPRTAFPDNYSIRHTCQDKAAYDRLIDTCLAHFADCAGCHGYEQTNWRERVAHINAGYQRKAADDCTCVNRMAVYTILTLLDRVWWAADPSARYTGPTTE